MTSINGLGGTQGISNSDLGPTQSLQLMFAQLQLELAAASKSSAMDRMEQIRASQGDQKYISQLLNEARQQQANAKGGQGDCSWDKKASMMSTEMKDYMDKNGLAYDKTGNDRVNNEDEWKVAITALEGRLEQVGTDTQQQMVYIQDFMGQYNSYLQGANTQISQSNQTLSALARGQ